MAVIKPALTRALVVSMVCVSVAAAQSNLPAKVQADMLLPQIVEAMGKGNNQAVLKGIADYRALKVPVPLGLLFAEADAAAAQKDYSRSQLALEDYFKTAQASDIHYAEAIRLYPQVKQAAEDAKQRKQLADEETARKAREEALKAAEPKVAGMVAAIANDMISIPAGTFGMGDPSGERPSHVQPLHRVSVRAFRLSKYEVTFDQYDVFAQVSGRVMPESGARYERGNRPVVKVSWDDAQAFIAWLNQVTGAGYRLPTEAEWEYAARAGSKTDYPWGKQFDANKANGGGANGADTYEGTAPVGSFPPNSFGVYDMIGNAWEWTQDCPNDDNEGMPTDGSAFLKGNCTRRVFRGGSWSDPPANLRVSNRHWNFTTFAPSILGFRLAQADH